MRSYGCMLIKLLVIQCLILVSISSDFDCYSFVQQWPVSYCDNKGGCCFPTTGKPAEDFTIIRLWATYNNGSYPKNCGSGNSFDASEISDLKSRLQEDWPTLACPSSDGLEFWKQEWNRHGTCSNLDQHSYFEHALDLKHKVNLLQALNTAGITPANGKYYNPEDLKEAIKEGTVYTPVIGCNVDALGNYQLYNVYMCVDKFGSEFIECPVFPRAKACDGSGIEFPSFSAGT